MTAGPEDPKAAAAAARAAARAEASAKAEAAKAEAAAAKAEAAAAKGEAAERERLARAPMPPERPAALEKPTPLDAASAEKKLAALEPNDNVKLRGNLSETGQAQGKTDEDLEICQRPAAATPSRRSGCCSDGASAARPPGAAGDRRASGRLQHVGRRIGVYASDSR